MEFTEEYPNRPPLVKFASQMFHPNIYADGGICLDILQNQWSPIYDVAGVLTSIQVRACGGKGGEIGGAGGWSAAAAGRGDLSTCPLFHFRSPPPFTSLSSRTPTPTRPPTQRPPACTARTGGSTTGG